MACRQYDLTGSGDTTYSFSLFPEPLTKEKENYFLRMIYTGQRKEAREVLVRHNLRLVSYIAEKYRFTKEEMGDLISVGTIGLIQAVNTYNPEKETRLATYAAKCIENEIRMFLRGRKKREREISMETVIGLDAAGNKQYVYEILASEGNEMEEKFIREAEQMLVHEILDQLTDVERRLIILRYGMDRPGGKERTQCEVADILGISQSYLSRLEKKILIRMKRELAG